MWPVSASLIEPGLPMLPMSVRAQSSAPSVSPIVTVPKLPEMKTV